MLSLVPGTYYREPFPSSTARGSPICASVWGCPGPWPCSSAPPVSIMINLEEPRLAFSVEPVTSNSLSWSMESSHIDPWPRYLEPALPHPHPRRYKPHLGRGPCSQVRAAWSPAQLDTGRFVQFCNLGPGSRNFPEICLDLSSLGFISLSSLARLSTPHANPVTFPMQTHPGPSEGHSAPAPRCSPGAGGGRQGRPGARA